MGSLQETRRPPALQISFRPGFRLYGNGRRVRSGTLGSL